MDRKKTNDVAELVRLGLPTFVNTLGKELQRDGSVQVNACELAQNRDKMIKYTCLAGLGTLGLLAFGIAGLINRE